MDVGEMTFKANFTSDGVALLRERVKEKLRELMGEYTDDTLVEYVVVLLRNGRRKDEAEKELKVFLGGDNDAFVSWLWDHLSSNLHLYVQPKSISTNDEAKNTPSVRGFPVQNSTSNIQTSHEREADTQKTTRVQQKREWGGIVRGQSESIPLRSVIAPVSHEEEKNYHNSHVVRRALSPDMQHHKKRGREEDARPIKGTPHQVIGATRRLLQFAVRDAVRPVQPVTLRSESSSKRLRSVVSTAISQSAVNDRLQKIKSDVRIPGATAALRAAAEAAEDVCKDKYSESVFNRLGRRRLLIATEKPFEDGEYENIDNAREEDQVDERNQYFVRHTYMYDRETKKASGSADIDPYDDARAVRHNGLGSYQSTLHSNGSKQLLAVRYNMGEGAALVRSRRSISQDTHGSAGPRPSEKMLIISADRNTRSPPKHELTKVVNAFEPQVPMEKKCIGSRQSNVTIASANDVSMPDNSSDLVHSSSFAEAQKASSVAGGLSSTGQPEGGADSRTVFISNVHFGATKDSLSRHFNKFGAVIKTHIVTDGVTGQPIGSAYIEFLDKESAEQALTLNGVSFMSRILKVVRKSSVEVSQLLGWSRAARGSPFASRLTRTAYPRPTFPGAIRGRLALRGTTRSLQWKRGTADSADAGKPSPTKPATLGSQMARSFTYTRSEAKHDVGVAANI